MECESPSLELKHQGLMLGSNADIAASLYSYSRAQELIDSALKDRGIKSGEGTEKEPLVGASRPEHTRSGYTDILTSMIPRRNRAETMGF